MLVSLMKQCSTPHGLSLKHDIVVLNEMDFIDLEYFKEIFLTILQKHWKQGIEPQWKH